jgi:mitotic spindle assembly checkpoint protein MAD1
MAQASLERQILALQTAKLELEAKLREKDTTIHGLERDRRWLSDREQEEREAREKERAEFEAHKVIIT